MSSPNSDPLASDDAIPMLTEIVDVPQPVDEDPDATEAGPVDWEALADRVHDAVTVRLLKRVDSVISIDVRDALHATLMDVVNTACARLRTVISQEVSDAVSQAVADELERQRSGPRSPGG